MKTTKQRSRSSSKFNPSWLLLIVIVGLFSYFAFTMLAPWQLGKDKDIVQRNDQIAAAFNEDPKPIQDVLDSTGTVEEGHEWARVTMTGHYLPDREVLLRMRPVSSGASFQSLVPFQTTAGMTVLVNRGWEPAGDGGKVPSIDKAPSGEVTIQAMVRKGEGVHPNAPINEEGYEQVYSINTPQIGQVTGVQLATDYVQLSDSEPGVLQPIPVPQMDRGNHLSYGYQWIAFGIMAPLGAAYFIWAEIRERRRAQREQEEMDAAFAASQAAKESPGSGPEPHGTQPHSTSTDSASNSPASALAPTSESTAPERAQEPIPEHGSEHATPARKHRARYGDARADHYAKFAKRDRQRF